MIATIIGACVGAATLLAMIIGVVVWLVRLEGKVANSNTLLDLIRSAQAQTVEMARALAVVQTQIVHLENDRAPTAQILERLAGIEGQLKVVGEILAAEHGDKV